MEIKVSYVQWRVITKDEPSDRIKDLLRFATRLEEQKTRPTGGSNHGE